MKLYAPSKSAQTHFREIESCGGGSRIHSLALHYEVMGATNALEMSVHLLASMLPVHKDYYY